MRIECSFLVFLTGVLCFNSILAQSNSRNANDVVKFSPNCHFSCSACTGPSFTECVKCRKGASLIQTGKLTNVTIDGLNGKQLSVIYGECSCTSTELASGSPTALSKFNATLEYVTEGCRTAKDIDTFIDKSGKWLAISNFILATITLIAELRISSLLDFFDTVQFFGNFAQISQKNLRAFDNLAYAFMRSNPTFLFNQISNSTDLNKNSIEVVEAISQFSSPIQFIGYSSIYAKTNITFANNLQTTPYFSLSQLLKSHDSSLSYASLSENFIIIITSLYAFTLVYFLLHTLFLRRYYTTKRQVVPIQPSSSNNNSKNKNTSNNNNNKNKPNSNNQNNSSSESSSESDSSSSSNSSSSPRAYETKIEAYRKEMRLEQVYKKSTYFTVYCYLITCSLTFFYISINEQFLYIQVAFYLDTVSVDASSSASMVFVALFLSAHVIQAILMSQRPDSPFEKFKTVIFDGIKQQSWWGLRKIALVKITFKIIESLIFFQKQHEVPVMCSLLLASSVIQLLIYALMRPFNYLKSNVLLVAQQVVKIILVSLFFAANSLQSNTPNGSETLDNIYLTIPVIQIFYLMGLAITTIVEYIYRLAQRVINWKFARNFAKQQEQSNLKTPKKEKEPRLGSDAKDSAALIEMSASKNNQTMMLQDQSTLYFGNELAQHNISQFYDGSPEFKPVQKQSLKPISLENVSASSMNTCYDTPFVKLAKPAQKVTEITIPSDTSHHRHRNNNNNLTPTSQVQSQQERWMHTTIDHFTMNTQEPLHNDPIQRISPWQARKSNISKSPSPSEQAGAVSVSGGDSVIQASNNSPQLIEFEEIKETLEDEANSEANEGGQQESSNQQGDISQE